jgi:predicted TIM-barrel fold metal-dependent hydrolase
MKPRSWTGWAEPEDEAVLLIDAHTHILSLAEDAEFTTEYGREGSLCIYRSLGKLPAHRAPTEQEWEDSGYSRRGFPVIGPAESIRDHPGFDKIVILAVSPQFLDGELIGTVDSYGITGVPGPPTPEKCNDYIAAIVAARPDVFIGYASVNPAYHGPKAAVRELERAVTELGLTGLKLYPMYQDWSPADPVTAFPVFARAEELGIPVMVHQAGSTRIDARMEYARPALLDAAGRHFRELRLTIAHCGLPWADEALFMLTKHPNFFAELSYYIATVTPEELFRFLVHAQQSFVPLEKLFFGTDYPGFLYDPVELRAKLLSVNDYAGRVGAAPIPQAKLDGIMGGNYARMLGLL